MKFYGLIKSSMVDYPGFICATVFTKGCNMRCSFCHNPDLVFPDRKPSSIDEEEIISFLETRKGKLDGVCITGGEPTIHGNNLLQFITRVKEMGFLVKLDSNGTNPSFLQRVIEKKVVDYVAMDVKSSVARYCEVSGLSSSLLPNIIDSISLLKRGLIDYEFRTTIVRGMHDLTELASMAKLIEGSPRFIFQRANCDNAWDETVRGRKAFTDIEMDTFVLELKHHYDGKVSWR